MKLLAQIDGQQDKNIESMFPESRFRKESGKLRLRALGTIDEKISELFVGRPNHFQILDRWVLAEVTVDYDNLPLHVCLLGQAKAKYEIFMNFKGQIPVAGESHMKSEEATFTVTQEDVQKYTGNETIRKPVTPKELITEGAKAGRIGHSKYVKSFGDLQDKEPITNINTGNLKTARINAFQPILITEAPKMGSSRKVDSKREKPEQTSTEAVETCKGGLIKIVMKIYTNSKEVIITPTITTAVLRKTKQVKEDLFSKQNMLALNKRLEECRRMKESIARELGFPKSMNDSVEGSKRRRCDILIANRDQAKNYLDHRIKQISSLSFINNEKIEAIQIRAKKKLQENKAEKINKIHDNIRRKDELRLERLRAEQKHKTMKVLEHYKSVFNIYRIFGAIQKILWEKKMDALQAKVFLKKVIFIQRKIKQFFARLPPTRLERRLVDGGRTLQGLGMFMAALARKRAVNTAGRTMSCIIHSWIIKNKFLTYNLYSKIT
jgi:hypothetical protein